MTASPIARVGALRAGIDALVALEQFGHASVLTMELFAVLETLVASFAPSFEASKSDTAPSASREKPAVLMETRLELTCTAAPARQPQTAAQRAAAYRARKKSQRARTAPAVDPRQLPIETVTRHVTNVTPSVTVGVTERDASRDLFSRPSEGLEKRGDCTPVTRDAVTAVTLPELLPEELRGIFDYVLARRPGVTLDGDKLWAKFRTKNKAIASRPELRFKWTAWCKTEWPTKALPLTPPRASSGPGVRFAGTDPAERSRLVAEETREQQRQQEAEHAATHEERRRAAADAMAELQRSWSTSPQRRTA